MTKITYIHSIPSDEMRDRSALVGVGQRYLPYTDMTEGEMKLALLSEQARMLSQSYPEMRYLQDARAMLDNALYAGVHGGINYTGVIDPRLFDIAKSIQVAKNQYRPATGDFLVDRGPMSKITGIGAPIVPVTEEDCEDYATRKANAWYKIDRKKFWWKALPVGGQKGRWNQYKAECAVKKEIEGILNRSITGSSHHVVYKSLDVLKPFLRGSLVRTKKLLHLSGLQGLGNAAEVNKTLMDQWVETALMQANSREGFGPVDSVVTSLSIAPNAQALANEYFKTGTDAKVGAVLTVIAGVTALVGAIAKAVSAASEMQKELNAKKAGVMGAAQGFGTEAFRAESSDYDSDAPQSQGQTAGNNTIIYAGGAALLGYFLFAKK